MKPFVTQLRELSSAEEILRFFGVSYEPRVLNVNRLHILKRFNQYLAANDGLEGLPHADALQKGRELLSRAYEDFVHSSAVEQKVFPVFMKQQGLHRVSLDALNLKKGASRHA